MYRRSARLRAKGQGDLVILRSYSDSVSAEIDRAHLESAGITAHVFDGMSFNPLIAANIGAIKLQVAEGDVAEASEVLGVMQEEEAEADDEGEGTVRCPRCELAYCFYERPRLRNAHPGVAFLLLPVLMVVGEKRWRCQKCGHTWDDPKEGPSSITRLKAGDPRPVFRLRRTHAGTGFLLAFGVGIGVSLFVHGPLGAVLCLVVAASGIMIGRAFHHDVCSVPDCRAPLPRDAEECTKCKGGIAGVIESAEEHYSAAADFRRELAGIRAEARKKKQSKKKINRQDAEFAKK